MANMLFAGIPLDGSGSRPLDADLYGTEQGGVDAENISATGNLNLGNVLRYDEHAQRGWNSGNMETNNSTSATSVPDIINNTFVPGIATGTMTTPRGYTGDSAIDSDPSGNHTAQQLSAAGEKDNDRALFQSHSDPAASNNNSSSNASQVTASNTIPTANSNNSTAVNTTTTFNSSSTHYTDNAGNTYNTYNTTTTTATNNTTDDTGHGILSGLTGTVDSTVSNLTGTVTGTLGSVTGTAGNIVHDVLGTVGNLGGNAISAVTGTVNGLTSTTGNILTDLTHSVTDIAGNLSNTVTNPVEGVLNTVENSLNGSASGLVTDLIGDTGISNALHGLTGNGAPLIEANNSILSPQLPEAGGASLINSNLALLGQTSSAPNATGGSALINVAGSVLTTSSAGTCAADGLSVSVNTNELLGACAPATTVNVPLPSASEIPILPQVLGTASSASAQIGQSLPEVQDPAATLAPLPLGSTVAAVDSGVLFTGVNANVGGSPACTTNTTSTAPTASHDSSTVVQHVTTILHHLL